MCSPDRTKYLDVEGGEYRWNTPQWGRNTPGWVGAHPAVYVARGRRRPHAAGQNKDYWTTGRDDSGGPFWPMNGGEKWWEEEHKRIQPWLSSSI